jgi:dynein heavy chain
MYEVAAFRGKDKLKSVFTFADNDVVKESFLEDIQNMLNAGVVPNLYTNDELNKLRDECRKPFKKANPGAIESPEAISEFFFDNIKNNLHLSVCMSPIGRAFRDYTRMFPALINNTTLDWFMPWPADALTEVAGKFIGAMDLGEKVETGLAKLCAVAHSSTQDNADLMRQELKRVFYVTPTNYVELLKGYGAILKDKRLGVDTQRTKLRNGLSKLATASKQVEEMSKEAEVARAEVSKA